MAHHEATLFTEPAEEPSSKEDEEYKLTTKNGYPLNEAISALQKMIRRGREEEALFWGNEIWTKYPAYFWRRLCVIASEDCSSNPMAAILTGILAINSERSSQLFKGKNEGVMETQAILYLARSEKSREASDAIVALYRAKKSQGWRLEIPDVALDKHTLRGKQMGRTVEHFRYEGRYVAGPRGVNRYEVRSWGFVQPDLPVPEDQESLIPGGDWEDPAFDPEPWKK